MAAAPAAGWLTVEVVAAAAAAGWSLAGWLSDAHGKHGTGHGGTGGATR